MVTVQRDSELHALLIDWDKPMVTNQCPSMFQMELTDCVMLMLAIQCGRLLEETVMEWLNPTEERPPTIMLHRDATVWERFTVATQ